MLFQTPPLNAHDRAVLGELDDYRRKLRNALREPGRGTDNLRRNLQARAIRGSNTIEGYEVTLDDALAAVDDSEPLEADQDTWTEIIGYRNAMSYVQQLAHAEHFEYNATLLSSLHYMMLSHDLAKLPGRFRPDPIYVHDDDTGENVYEGPDAELVRGLIDALVAQLYAARSEAVFVRAAMAHLNLVMIHPFKDGNGRMARALQTLVLAREGVLAPEFSSIEEYLGSRRNTQEYYAVLALVGAAAGSQPMTLVPGSGSICERTTSRPRQSYGASKRPPNSGTRSKHSPTTRASQREPCPPSTTPRSASASAAPSTRTTPTSNPPQPDATCAAWSSPASSSPEARPEHATTSAATASAASIRMSARGAPRSPTPTRSTGHLRGALARSAPVRRATGAGWRCGGTSHHCRRAVRGWSGLGAQGRRGRRRRRFGCGRPSCRPG